LQVAPVLPVLEQVASLAQSKPDCLQLRAQGHPRPVEGQQIALSAYADAATHFDCWLVRRCQSTSMLSGWAPKLAAA
jgi:hypothetical protein